MSSMPVPVTIGILLRDRSRVKGSLWCALLIATAWMLVSLLVSTQLVWQSRMLGGRIPFPWVQYFLVQLGYWYGWALWTPVIFVLARRYPLAREGLLSRLLVHVLVGSCVVVAMHVWSSALTVWISQASHGAVAIRHAFVLSFFVLHHDLLIYSAILAVGLLLDYRVRLRERTLQTAELRTQLVQARLNALRMQIHPHFLFNTMHAISALVAEDPAGARRTIARLSHLLRLTLDLGERDEIRLGDELEIVRGYLEIEAVRFGDRLEVEQRIDSECLDLLVPTLVLQPLVENAIKHGVERRTGRCQVAIIARRDGADLLLAVEDRGPGPDSAAGSGEGLGLTNTRERLEKMYPGQGRLSLRPRTDGGCRSEVCLPIRCSPRSTGEEGSEVMGAVR